MQIKKLFLAVLVPGIIILVHGAAFGGFDTYLEIDGIVGESTADSHSTNWRQAGGAPNPSSPKPGPGAATNRNRGELGPGIFTIVKQIDRASPRIAEFRASGKTIPEVKIKFCPSGSKQSYLIYTLQNVIVSGVNSGGSSHSPSPVETVHFRYSKIQWEYTSASSGSGEDNGESGWDWNFESKNSR
jgi:type VI secretion system secreted protein Hcp